ncbi:MAG: hypothetical protein ACLS7Z_03715 [Christensenellales bacterium]
MKSIDLFFVQPWLCCWPRLAAAFVLLAPRLLRWKRKKSRTTRGGDSARGGRGVAGGHRRGPGNALPDRAADGGAADQSASMEPVRAQADAWAEEAKRTSTRRSCRLPHWRRRSLDGRYRGTNDARLALQRRKLTTIRRRAAQATRHRGACRGAGAVFAPTRRWPGPPWRAPVAFGARRGDVRYNKAASVLADTQGERRTAHGTAKRCCMNSAWR